MARTRGVGGIGGFSQHVFTDPDAMADGMQPVAPGVRLRAVDRGPFRCTVRTMLAGDLALFSVRGSPACALIEPSSDYLCVHLSLAAPFEVVEGSAVHSVSRSDCYLKLPQASLDCRKHAESEVLAITGFLPLLDRWGVEAGASPGRGLTALPRLLSLRTAPGQALRRYAAYLWAEGQRDSPLMRSPLVAQELGKGLLSALMLAAETEPPPPGSPAHARGQLRPATDFIAARLAQPLTLADIAAAAGVQPRTLQRRFRARYGRSVMAFVRERRLEAVHAALAAGNPDDTSVTRMAVEHGFAHLGRFAADYQRRFGEPPSQTLRG